MHEIFLSIFAVFSEVCSKKNNYSAICFTSENYVLGKYSYYLAGFILGLFFESDGSLYFGLLPSCYD